MALEKSFRALQSTLNSLSERLSELRVAIGDRPPENDVALFDMLNDAVDDLLGWASESAAAAADGVRAVEPPLDLDRASRALAVGQEHLHQMMPYVTFELSGYERLEALTTLGRERSGEWPEWVDLVKGLINDCQHALFDASNAYFQCWQEIAERVGTLSVSVRSTNIGQQIRAPNEEEHARTHYP